MRISVWHFRRLIPAFGIITRLLDSLLFGVLLNAFHEKAGRSQVDSDRASLNKFLSFPAEWPLSPCFHPHSRGANRFARCMLAFSFQPVLPSVWRPVVLLLQSGTRARRLTQSPELGFGFCLFSSWSDFDFVLTFCFMRLPPRSFGCCCVAVRILRRLPTSDAATPPAFWRSQRWLASRKSSVSHSGNTKVS